MIILPILSLFMMYIYIGLHQKFIQNGQNNRTLAMLYSIAINTLIILLSTEILSLFHAIQYISLSVLWFTVDITLLLMVLLSVKNKSISLLEIKGLFAFPKIIFNPIDIFVFVVCCAAVYMAARTVPYNWDSMTYHLTRIAHWVQNGSVSHYVCHDISQISASPLAEFVNLHVYILSGYNDYLVNFLQTFSYLIIIFLIYKICEIIGCNRFFSSLSALIFATSPVVFGEAFSTQVDMYSGLWLVVFVYVILSFIDINHKLQWNYNMICKLILIGMSGGFAYLAKSSVCIAAFVFTIWLFVVCILRKDNIFIVTKSIVITTVVALIIVMPEMVRNFITFHGISSSETSTDFLVQSYNMRYLFVNLIENIIYNLWPNNILDINLFMSHDTAINPLIFFLMILSILWGGVNIGINIRKSKTELQISWGYIIASMISMLLFCTIVQWYKYITRYEVGYIALLAPAVMLVFQYVLSRRKSLICIFSGMIVFVSLITFVTSYRFHSAFLTSEGTRIELYFAANNLYEPYQKVTDNIIEKQYKDIGFFCGNNSYEYPLWKMLENFVNRFEHVGVTNETRIYDDENFLPECIIAVDREIDDVILYHNISYHLTLEESGVKLFER